MYYIVDIDDFEETGAQEIISTLNEIRKQVPGFKATLFTIPAKCSLEFIEYMKRNYHWLDLVPHGWRHPTPREAEYWTLKESLVYLSLFKTLGFTTYGFKAPGWQISDGTYLALAQEGWWVADQVYNNERRHKSIPVYLLDDDRRKFHYHVHNECNNDIKDGKYFLSSLDKNSEFGFVKDNVRKA